MKVGILGGTFDPPHVGHLALAKAAQKHLGLELVLWVPNTKNPLKKNVAEATSRQRLEMVQVLISDQPDMAVSDIELTREGPSYMCDTMEELLASQPSWDMWLILGADSLHTFMTWHYPERILKVARLAVAVRPGLDLKRLVELQAEPVQRKIDLIEMEPVRMSSTDIRAALAEHEPTDALTPELRKYIEQHGIYQPQNVHHV